MGAVHNFLVSLSCFKDLGYGGMKNGARCPELRVLV